MGFLRRNSNGSTGYHFLRKSGPIVKKDRENSNALSTIKKEMTETKEEENNNGETEMEEDNKDENNQDEDEDEDEQVDESRELPLMFGGLVEGLQSNSWTMASFLEDKKNKSSPSKTHLFSKYIKKLLR